MTEHLQHAREQRNTLERLINKIPGFRGFQDRELRRDVDRTLREHLAREVGALQSALRAKIRLYTDAGRIADLTLFDRLDRRLDGLSQRLRFADYGHSGLFDAVKIYQEELEKLYLFDLTLIEDLETLGADLAAIPEPGVGDPADAPRCALEQAQSRLAEIEEKWARRDQVMSAAVQASGQDE